MMKRWVLVIAGLAVLLLAGGFTNSGLQVVSPSGRYTCYSACPPAGTVTAVRAIDYGTGEYFEAAWTVIHDTNTKGQITLFDLSGGSIRDSLVVRLLPGLTYGGEELIADSIKALIWDTDDTTYVFGKGTKAVRRNWQGD